MQPMSWLVPYSSPLGKQYYLLSFLHFLVFALGTKKLIPADLQMAVVGCLLAELWSGLSRRHPVLAFTGVRGDGASQPAEQIPVLLTKLTTDVTSEGSSRRKPPAGWMRSPFRLSQPGSYGI